VNSTPATEKNKILCIIDFSFTSCEALNWAIHIAQKLRSHLCVMFVYRLIPSRAGELKNWKKDIEEETRQQFLMIEKHSLANTGVSYEFKIEIGFISHHVQEYAANNDLIFVVMDRKANINNTESIDEVLKDLRIPVLLLP